VRLRNLRPLAVAASAALVLAACADGDPADETTAPDGTEQPESDTEQPEAEGELEELDEEALEDLLAQQDEDPLADLPDPNDDVVDGAYRGSGVVVPVPEGWSLDPASFTQGVIVATPEDLSEQFFVQAVDTDTLPEEVTFDDVVDGNLEQAGQEPTLNEEVELDGATQARVLRFEQLPAQVEGEPDNSILLVVADDGDGRLGIFNYAAASEDFDDATAELLLDGAGFDPDSDPTPPAPAPAPAP
jgi:hypothetical protein